MNQELIDMAIEAQLNLYVNDLTEKQYMEVIEHFAALVAAAEREACAKVCEEPWQGSPKGIAESIRARGETK